MGVDEAVEGCHQTPPLRAAIVGIGADADDLELAAIVLLDEFDDLGGNRVVADIG